MQVWWEKGDLLGTFKWCTQGIFWNLLVSRIYSRTKSHSYMSCGHFVWKTSMDNHQSMITGYSEEFPFGGGFPYFFCNSWKIINFPIPFEKKTTCFLLDSFSPQGARASGEKQAHIFMDWITWLILPVGICLSKRLSHACVSINNFVLVKLRMAQ